MNFPIKAVISLVGVINGLFFALLLIIKNKSRANTYLALLLLSLSIRIAKSFLKEFFYAPYWVKNIGLLGFIFIGPLLYFYVRILHNPDFSFKRIHFFSMVPPILFLTSCLIFDQYNYLYMRRRYFAILLHLMVVIILTLHFWFQNYWNNNSLSQQRKNQSKWILNLVMGIFIVWLAYFSNIIILDIPYLLGPALYSFMFYIMIFWILNSKKTDNIFLTDKKYKYSNLTKIESRKYIIRLDEMMTKEKLYLDPEINLQKAAERLSILPLYLSQLINENLGQSFPDYINKYRLDVAQKYLQDPKNKKVKIITVAANSGFNSISSFNSVFKKKFSMSPSQFRKLKN